jgi:hypothetical protein
MTSMRFVDGWSMKRAAHALGEHEKGTARRPFF